MGERPKVFVTRRLPLTALELVRAVAETEVWGEPLPPSRAVMEQQVQEADGLLCLLTDKIDAELLDYASRLKVVSQMAVGYDNIDIAACTARNIPVGNTPGVLHETTADLAFALILAVARRIVEADAFTREGSWRTWSPMMMIGQDVHHSTLGIVGMGQIGFAVARRAWGFDMPILYTHPRPHEEAERTLGARRVPLEELLAQSDFVSLHVPLNAETRHMIGMKQLNLMKPTAYLINTARGPIVDQEALFDCVAQDGIAGAGLDVFETEPVPTSEPLLSLDNVVVLPHIGSASLTTRTRMAVLAAENLIAGLEGRPLPHCVNPSCRPQP